MKDRFVDQIKRRIKIHSLREDPKNRWKVGMKIQHWCGNPRNVRNNPYHFADDVLIGKQMVQIWCWDHEYDPDTFGLSVLIDGRKLSDPEIETLAINDGLSVAEFKSWFTPKGKPIWNGFILQFTDLKY